MKHLKISIGGRDVGDGFRPFFIAEMSCNHNKSLETALKIVDESASSGADAIKLQTFRPDTLTIDSDRPDFFINDPTSPWYKKRLWDLYAEAYIPWEWHKPIFDRARKRNLACISTAFDHESLEFLMSLGVDAIKIASFELVHIPLIKAAAHKGKPLIISTGMGTLQEIEDAVRAAREAANDKLILLKCTSAYPAQQNDANLITIQDMRKRFDVLTGLSDHSMGIGVSLGAVALGASVIEKHFTLNRISGGLDASFSMEPSEFRRLVNESTVVYESIGKVYYGRLMSESASSKERPSIYVVKDIKKGEKYSTSNIRIIRPSGGIMPKFYDEIIGKAASRDLTGGIPLTEDMIIGYEERKRK